MFAKPISTHWSLVAAYTILFQCHSTHALRGATSTPTGLTQVGIATDCNMFAYADPENTCNEAVARFGITLSQLTSWNPVLGYPDGKYCQVQFWAGYDYCVGVISRASPDGGMASTATAPSDGMIADDAGTASTATAPPAEMIADKRYVGLPDDGGPEDYLIQDINCTDLSGKLYQECWQELNMNSWLR